MRETDSELDKITKEMFAPNEAKAFILRHLQPATGATERAIEALRVELGLQRRDNIKRALCGFLWACQRLSERGSDLLAFPSSKPTYSNDGGGYDAFMSVKSSLLEQCYIKREREGAADHARAAIYKLLRSPDTTGLTFEEIVPANVRLVQVKREKDKFGDADEGKAPPLSRKIIEQYHGRERIEHEEAKVRRIVDFLSDYPLEMGNTSFRGLRRIFNNNSLERGGRLYAGYSSLPKTLRPDATLDGQPIAQIDIKASYLCVRAGMAGYKFEEGSDPYQLVPWVHPCDRRTRDFAKKLISTLISYGGDKPRLPSELKEEFKDIIKPKQTITHFKAPIHDVFPFLLDYVDGLEVMFKESEMMMAVLDHCIDEGLPAWPLHDCVFVRQSDADRATEIIKSEFNSMFGFRPTITLNDDKDS